MKVAILAVLSLVGSSTFAQQPAQPSVRTVKVLSDSESHDVAAAVEARLKATTRYSMVPPDSTQYELAVSISCMHLKNTLNEDMHAYACRYDFAYSLSPPLSTPEYMGGSLIVASDVSWAAERIFQEFVNHTTDANLAFSETMARFYVLTFCSDAKNKAACSGIAKK